MNMIVKDHEKDLAESQAKAKDRSDPDAKNFADKTGQGGPGTPRFGQRDSRQAAIGNTNCARRV